MSLDIKKPYFLMSYKFDKTSPRQFGLIESPRDNKQFICPQDDSSWKKMNLYDFGWGNEVGFVRLPELSFEELWHLLVHSPIESNRYGSAHLIVMEHQDELLNHLLILSRLSAFKITNELKRAFHILKLQEVRNRNSIVGKSVMDIRDDFEKWKLVSDRLAPYLQ